MPRLKVAGAAGAAVRRRLLAGAAVGVVEHAGAQALYARFGDRIVGVTARGAVLVPAAIGTTLPRLPGVAPGAPARIGDGLLHVADLAVGVDRLVDTSVPTLPDPHAAASRLARSLPDLDVVRRQLPATALELLGRGHPGAVRPLLGLGDGLTPVGDDVVAGWLVTARAAGRDPAPIARAVAGDADRTTTLSATLLAHAVEGECLPELRSLLLELRAGRDPEAAVERLAEVGHSSGLGMLLGAHLALAWPSDGSRS